jgi:hypothetical protein
VSEEIVNRYSTNVLELQSMIKLVMPLGLAPKPPVVPSNDDKDPPTPPIANTAVFHSTEMLFQEIDPAFLANQIRNGKLDYGIFRTLANTMKSYCKCERDEAVDKMAASADVGSGMQALRWCFEILLQMRIVRSELDLIAVLIQQDQVNGGELMRIRPWLEDTAIYHELASFERALDYEKSLLEDSDTRHWIFAASQRVLDAADMEQTAHLLGQCQCKNRTEFVIRSIVEGVGFLIFANWSEPDKCDWKKFSGVPSRSHEGGSNCHMPESMRKDTNRLYHLSYVTSTYVDSFADR